MSTAKEKGCRSCFKCSVIIWGMEQKERQSQRLLLFQPKKKQKATIEYLQEGLLLKKPPSIGLVLGPDMKLKPASGGLQCLGGPVLL